ncbi:MAG TPA: YecA family protein [Gammaproteobacteria bacterium]|nr:YecA family protein [Gammaproteobacteria bacterium]
MAGRHHKKLSAREVKALSAFLNHSDRPEDTLSFHELQGVLFAVCCAPELIPPSEWLPLISNEKDMSYADLDEAQHILGLVMNLYNQINTAVIERSDTMPQNCVFLADTEANFDDQAPVSQWSRGFILGHNWLGDLWNDCVPDEESEMSAELGACMMTLSFFCSRSISEAFYFEADDNERPMEQEPFEKFAHTVREIFPSALASYANIGRTIDEVLTRER